MKRLVLLILLVLLSAPLPSFAALELARQETINTGAGVKSVLVHPDGKHVYAVNLEGMSVHEFDRETRKPSRKLVFIPHRGEGYNYAEGKVIESYKEKPVEAHFTHNGRYMWISLHNAGGIVAWDLTGAGKPAPKGVEAYEQAYGKGATKTELSLPFIETGQTPKVITSSPDGKYLFVANWHSNTVSVIDISSPEPSGWKKLRDIRATIPRGLLVNPKSNRLYIAEMGDEHIIEVELPAFNKLRRMRVGLNPRHLIMDGDTLYISINLDSQVAALDLSNGSVKRTVACDKPRTMAMHPATGVIFSVCYRGEQLEAYDRGLNLLGSWPSVSHPVGVDVYSVDDTHMEAWVANYSSGSLEVFDFTYSPDAPLESTHTAQ